MTRSLLFSFLAFAAFQRSNAQFPSLEAHTVSSIQTVTLPYSKSSGKGKNKTEVPPWIIPGGLRSYFFVDGSDTYIWSSSSSLVHDKSLDLNNADGPTLASASYIHSPGYHPDLKINNWKRNYHAIYSAEYINHPLQGPVSLGFLHSENKNQVEGKTRNGYANLYQNTIQSNVPINLANHETYSGGTPFIEGWTAYNAMITAAWIGNYAGTNWGQELFTNELGPIAWPSTGYVTADGVKCTSGLKHPSSIIHDGYVYVFFSDGGPYGNNIPWEQGRLEGIKVVRAPVSQSLDPQAYTVFYKDSVGNDIWLPALPAGFTKETMLDYVAVRGPQSTDIMNDQAGTSQHIRFSVARVRNKNYFIGVEEYIDIADAMKFKVALRFSYDLINWGDRSLVVAEAADWDKTQMNYPIFLDKEGWTNTEIDLDDFYILGTNTSPQKHVNKIRLRAAANTTQLAMTVTDASLNRAVSSLVYPNPTYGSFRVTYTVDEPSRVRISLRDLSGRTIAQLGNHLRNNGRYTEAVNIGMYPAGMYFVEVATNQRNRLFKIVKF